MEICKREAPRQLDLDGHLVRCHAVEQKLAADAESAD
jgi:hypothetical protein